MSRQIDQEIIQATDELKKDVALTTEIITGNKHTVVEVAPGNTVRSPKKMIEDCYRETQQAIEQKFGSLDQAVNDATAAADRADSASQSASDSAGDSATSATTASQKAQEADASATKAASNEQAAGNSATQSATSAANAKASETAAGQSAVNAADSATAAATSATTATTESEQAGQSAATATQQATRAQAWAANPVDELVEGELYSSLHYARQSSDSAANSAASANRAEASATQAKTSETASASSASQAQGSATSAGSSASDALNSANNAKASETATQQAASTAQTAEQNAQESASQAGASETSAASSASTATQQADRSESEADRSEAAAASLKAISNPNLLINGGMSVWQRGYSHIFPSTIAGRYCADRWVHWGNINGISKSPASDPGIKSITCLRIVQDRNTDTLMRQIVEFGTAIYLNKTITVSFYAISNDIVEGFTGVGININDMQQKKLLITSSWKHYSVSVKVEQNSGAEIPGGHMWVDFQLFGNEIYITDCKAELGSIATPFIPDDPAINLVKCQRYYQKSYPTYLSPTTPWNGHYFVTTPDGLSFGMMNFPVVMRTAPTTTMYGITGKPGMIHEYAVGDTPGIASFVNETGFMPQKIGGGGAIGRFYVFNYTADAEL